MKVMTGEVPFEKKENDAVRINAITDGERPEFKKGFREDNNIPEGLVTFVSECWAQDAARRPSAKQIEENLSQWSQGSTLSTQSHPVADNVDRRPSNSLVKPLSPSAGSVEVFYAVAVYPYTAKMEDEFDVDVYVFAAAPAWSADLKALLVLTVMICLLSVRVHEGGGLCNEILTGRGMYKLTSGSKAGSRPVVVSKLAFRLWRRWRKLER